MPPTTLTDAEQATRPVPKRLVEAAEELFYSQGIAATGVDAVLSRAQVAIGSLYHHFGSKDNLAVAYLDSRHARWTARWEAAVNAVDTPVARVLAVFTALEQWNRDAGPSRGCADLAALTSLAPDHPAAMAARRHKRDVAERLKSLVESAVPEDRAGRVTDEIALLYDGALARLAVIEPSTDGEDPLEAARDLARHALDG